MTDETRETLTKLVSVCRVVLGFAKSWEPLTPGDLADLRRATDAADAALRDVLTPRTCSGCKHADTDDITSGWCSCAAPNRAANVTIADHNRRYPFQYWPVPLDEGCKGWQAREGEGGAR